MCNAKVDGDDTVVGLAEFPTPLALDARRLAPFLAVPVSSYVPMVPRSSSRESSKSGGDVLLEEVANCLSWSQS